MVYNLHPIFVHFPIAFLLLYSLLVILPLHRWFPRVSWKVLRTILLAAGLLGMIAANMTGETAEHLVEVRHDIVEMHALFAAVAGWVYGIAFASELITYVRHRFANILRRVHMNEFILFIEHVITHRVVVVTLALIGVLAMAVTGLLGGVLVYGITADPLAPLVLRLLGL